MEKNSRALDVVPGVKFKHFKGNIYEIVCLAKHTESEEDLVVYKSEVQTYARPLEMFLSGVDKEKYPDETQRYRFEVYN